MSKGRNAPVGPEKPAGAGHENNTTEMGFFRLF
jgi:hypothetical protein